MSTSDKTGADDTTRAAGAPLEPPIAIASSSRSSTQAMSSVAGPSVSDSPTKRGPGRPRKRPLPPSLPEGEAPPKKKRGRPPRPRTEAERAAEEARKNMPKRPRGRPRKNPLPTTRPAQPPQPAPGIAGPSNTSSSVSGLPSSNAAAQAGAPTPSTAARSDPSIMHDFISQYTHFPQ